MSLSMDQLSLSQSQTPLLYMKDDWVWQMALHEKQWTENHLKQFHIHTNTRSEMCRLTGAPTDKSIPDYSPLSAARESWVQ